MIDYLEIYASTKYKKNEIKKIEHQNLYNDYFSGTAKLWNNYDTKINLIENRNFGRIFLKNDKPSYFEIFEEPRMEIMSFSKKITLLYAPKENDKDNYDTTKCIGIRYYEKSRNEKCNYFTLVKKYGNRFFILEKNKEIHDFEDNEFYDEKLDCYSIMKNIVFEKYKNDIITPKGEVFPEIIGFIYSLIPLGKFKGFKVVEPLIIEPLNEESKIENLPDLLEDNIGYIEPIIFDNHISVALIKKSTFNNKGRVNIILDMSRYHIENNLLDNTVFPRELYLNNYPYPKYSIQKGNSCGLWCYGIIECIYSNDKYKNIDDISYAINRNNPEFFIDVINCLSYNIYGISDIIDNSSIETEPNIKENRIYELGQISNYSFRKEAITNYYFSLASLFAYYENKNDNYENKLNGIELLLEYQYLIDNIKNFLGLVIFNNNYFKIKSTPEIYEIDQKKEYEILIKSLRTLLNKVIKNCEKEFDNALYSQLEENLNYGILKGSKNIQNAHNNLKRTIQKISKLDIIDINKLKREFSDIKFSERKIVIKEESIFAKYINPNSEFYFQMMIH